MSKQADPADPSWKASKPGAPSAEWTAKWYSADPPDIKPEVREVLETYSKIPSDEVVAHVTRVREQAWAIYPYPCIGQWRFLDLAIQEQSKYPEILERMRTGDQIFLDLGCSFAQDIRGLVADGIDSRQCYGVDLQLDFLELGYDLFRDRETLQTKFIAADIFEPKGALDELEGKVDIMGTFSFFHLFSWDEQKKVAKQILKLLRPVSGSLLVGRQVGAREPSEQARKEGSGSRYRHNMETWRRFWKEVGEEAGVTLEVDGVEDAMPKSYKNALAYGDMVLQFSVRRM